MEQWTGEQRAYAVKAYYLNGEKLGRARQAYRDHYNVPDDRRVPSNKAIRMWITNFEATGSTCKAKAGRTKPVRTPENIEAVRQLFHGTSHQSAMRNAIAMGLSNTSVRRILQEDLRYQCGQFQVRIYFHSDEFI